MFKKSLCLLLTGLMLLSVICGCNSEQNPGESSGISLETNGTAATEATKATSLPSTGFITLPDKIYTTCGNYNLTFYSWHAKKQSFSFYIMTEERLTPLAEITLPGITTPYSVNIGEPEFTLQQSLPLVLYAWWKSNYAFDIAEYARLYSTGMDQIALQNAGLLDASLINPQTNRPYTADQFIEIENRYIHPYADARRDYLDSISAGTYQPEWFWYEVEIRFEERIARTEETTEILLSAGDESYRIPIERLRLVSEENPLPKRQIHGGCGFETTPFPWQGDTPTIRDTLPRMPIEPPWGSEECYYAVSIKALEDIYLTDAYIYDNAYCSISNVYVYISGKQGITNVEYTPGTPLLIRKGESAYLIMYYNDPHATQAHYAAKLIRVFEFECENGTYCVYGGGVKNCDSTHIRTHEIYLWQFKGVDLESYYRDYHQPWEEWLIRYMESLK